MNGRTRPGPDVGICPACGRTVALLIDATLSVHTPTGDPYAPACTGQRPVWLTARESSR